MPRTAQQSRVDPAIALLRAYSASGRLNQYLVERLDPAVWRTVPPAEASDGKKVRSIAALVAHLHNCGLRYLERTDPAAGVPKELDRARVTPAQAARALGAKRKAALRVLGDALESGRRIVGYQHDAATYLIYYLAHDSHHRGQIVLQARLLGHPISEDTMLGMWQWRKREGE